MNDSNAIRDGRKDWEYSEGGWGMDREFSVLFAQFFYKLDTVLKTKVYKYTHRKA